METKDLEFRVRRLEQLHIWGGGILALALAIYIAKKIK